MEACSRRPHSVQAVSLSTFAPVPEVDALGELGLEEGEAESCCCCLGVFRADDGPDLGVAMTEHPSDGACSCCTSDRCNGMKCGDDFPIPLASDGAALDAKTDCKSKRTSDFAMFSFRFAAGSYSLPSAR